MNYSSRSFTTQGGYAKTVSISLERSLKTNIFQTLKLDCEVSENGIAGLRREYQTLIDAGVGDTHEWLDSEDKILAKVPLLPRENIKVRSMPSEPTSGISSVALC